MSAAIVNHSLTIIHGFAVIFQQLRQSFLPYESWEKARWKVDAERPTMFRRPTKFGFAVPPRHEHAPHDGSTLPALIATLSLALSIAWVLGNWIAAD